MEAFAEASEASPAPRYSLVASRGAQAPPSPALSLVRRLGTPGGAWGQGHCNCDSQAGCACTWQAAPVHAGQVADSVAAPRTQAVVQGVCLPGQVMGWMDKFSFLKCVLLPLPYLPTVLSPDIQPFIVPLGLALLLLPITTPKIG